jgi:hypothetical protein
MFIPDPDFLTNKLSPSPQKYEFGIQDPGVKKAPDPGSGSATLPDTDPDLRPLPALLLFSNKAVSIRTSLTSTLVFLYLDSRRVHTLLQMWIRSLQTRFA